MAKAGPAFPYFRAYEIPTSPMEMLATVKNAMQTWRGSNREYVTYS